MARLQRRVRLAFGMSISVSILMLAASSIVACVGNDPDPVRNEGGASSDSPPASSDDDASTDGGSQTRGDGSGDPPILGSCRALYEAGFVTSGVYVIDPDGPSGIVQAFEVKCDMTTEGGGWTLAAVVSTREGDAGFAWSASTVWSESQPFGPSPSATDAMLDMKFPGWATVSATQIRFTSESADAADAASTSHKVSSVRPPFTLAQLFGSGVLIRLEGAELGAPWPKHPNEDTFFFGVVQNPPSTIGTNLGIRNKCVLTMAYDTFANGSDDQVSGYGCSAGRGPANVCQSGSCGDAVRENTLRLYIR